MNINRIIHLNAETSDIQNTHVKFVWKNFQKYHLGFQLRPANHICQLTNTEYDPSNCGLNKATLYFILLIYFLAFYCSVVRALNTATSAWLYATCLTVAMCVLV